MAFGNGSHSLKRGFLRPNGGSRLPAFLIIGLLAGCSLLLYNVYSTTVERNSLAEELGLLRKKWQACQKDKTELETRFETHVRTFKTVKDEVERLRTMERSLNENQKELKQCREQAVALQNENADLKEEQKTDVESCQRKLKAAEEKFEPCMQDKSRLESENDILRSNLTSALQQAQLAHQTVSHTTDVQRPTNVPVAHGGDRGQEQQGDDTGAIAPPAPPHRGAPDILDRAETPTKSPLRRRLGGNRYGAPKKEAFDTSNGTQQQQQQQQQQQERSFQAPLGERQPGVLIGEKPVSNGSITTSLTDEASTAERQAATTNLIGQEHGRTSSDVFQSADTSIMRGTGGDKALVQDPAVLTTGTFGILHKQEIAHENETNGTSVVETDQQPTVDGNTLGGPANLDQSSVTKRTRKQKERRRNKVIEESAPVDERRRAPVDRENDRSRGEQDDTVQPVETSTERVTLQEAIPKRIGVGDHLGLASALSEDTKAKTQPLSGSSINAAGIVATRTTTNLGILQHAVDEALTGRKWDQEETAKPTSILPHGFFDDEPKDKALAAPMDVPVVVGKPKTNVRKGLKDDYQYKDDDDDTEGALAKPGAHKKGAKRHEAAANAKAQAGGLSDANKDLNGGGGAGNRDRPPEDHLVDNKREKPVVDDGYDGGKLGQVDDNETGLQAP